MESTNTNSTREPSDLDWLFRKITIARAAWKTILVGFLALSILGGAALYATARPIYSSHMVMPMSPTMQALIPTDAVLAPVARKFASAGADIAVEVRRIQSTLTISSLTTGSGLFSISVTDHSPQRAQAVLDQILAQSIAISKPSGTGLTSTRQQIDSEKRALAQLKDLLAVFRDRASLAKSGTDDNFNARSFVTLISEIAEREQKLWELENRLEGFKVEDVVVRPTFDSQPDLTNRYRKLAIILLASFVLPVFFVLLRDLWRRRGSSHDDTPTLQHTA